MDKLGFSMPSNKQIQFYLSKKQTQSLINKCNGPILNLPTSAFVVFSTVNATCLHGAIIILETSANTRRFWLVLGDCQDQGWRNWRFFPQLLPINSGKIPDWFFLMYIGFGAQISYRCPSFSFRSGIMSGTSLAERWEAQPSLRALAREQNVLLVWAKPELMGIASSKACAMNAVALACCAEWWVTVRPAPCAIPIGLVREQARDLKTKLHVSKIIMYDPKASKSNNQVNSFQLGGTQKTLSRSKRGVSYLVWIHHPHKLLQTGGG